MGEIHELFVLALPLVWFAGATPDKTSSKMFSAQKVGLSTDHHTKLFYTKLSHRLSRTSALKCLFSCGGDDVEVLLTSGILMQGSGCRQENATSKVEFSWILFP